jgi:hypothetical protein
MNRMVDRHEPESCVRSPICEGTTILPDNATSSRVR